MKDPERLKHAPGSDPELRELLTSAPSYRAPSAHEQATLLAYARHLDAEPPRSWRRAIPWFLGSLAIATAASAAVVGIMKLRSAPIAVTDAMPIAVPAAPAVVVETHAVNAAPADEPPAPPVPRAAKRKHPTTPEPDAADNLLAEARLLEAARNLSLANPGGALAELLHYEQRFPRGQLACEKELIHIEVLERLGRIQEARQRAARFPSLPGAALYRERLDNLMKAAETP